MTRILPLLLLLLGSELRATVNWRDCGYAPFYFFGHDSSQQCAQLDVPLAYHHDHKSARRNDPRTVTLALSRLPATGAKHGSLVFIHGGPGQAGIYSGEAPGLDALREHFDLIFYDPRGVGYSRPTINCHAPGQKTPEYAHAFVKACQTHTRADFLPHIGSDEATDDLEQIRRALGEPQLNLVAYSYGTKIAVQYALRFPGHVRAVILDGVVDIFENPYAMRIHQEQGLQHAFAAYHARCTQTPLCPLAPHRADSTALAPFIRQHTRLQQLEQQTWQHQWQAALHNTAAAVADTLHNALRGKPAAPQPVETGQRETDPGILLSAIHGYLLWEELWPELDYPLRRYMMGDRTPLLSQNPLDGIRFDAMIAINCADMAHPLNDGENRILQRHLQHTAPFDNLLYPPDDRQYLDPCGMWPYPGGDHRNPPPAQKPAGLPPMLLIAQRHDPATPWHNAKRMADYLHSPLITLEGHGHTGVFTGYSACADELAIDYLRTPTAPPPDQQCAKDTDTGSAAYYSRPPAWY